MKIWIVFSFLLLAGCASRVLNDKLPNLVGKPISYAIDILGNPTSVTKYGRNAYYEWAFKHHGHIIQSGLVAISSTKNNCTITLKTKEDKIEDWKWEGNQNGCEFFVSSVEKIKDEN